MKMMCKFPYDVSDVRILFWYLFTSHLKLYTKIYFAIGFKINSCQRKDCCNCFLWAKASIQQTHWGEKEGHSWNQFNHFLSSCTCFTMRPQYPQLLNDITNDNNIDNRLCVLKRLQNELVLKTSITGVNS